MQHLLADSVALNPRYRVSTLTVSLGSYPAGAVVQGRFLPAPGLHPRSTGLVHSLRGTLRTGRKCSNVIKFSQWSEAEAKCGLFIGDTMSPPGT